MARIVKLGESYINVDYLISHDPQAGHPGSYLTIMERGDPRILEGEAAEELTRVLAELAKGAPWGGARSRGPSITGMPVDITGTVAIRPRDPSDLLADSPPAPG